MALVSQLNCKLCTSHSAPKLAKGQAFEPVRGGVSLAVVQSPPEWPAWAPKICEGCGSPRTEDSGRLFDPFVIFGVEAKFGHDLDSLRKRFYELSRALHPDRFSGMDENLQQASLDRMCQINLAYQTLRNSEKLRELFFERFSISPPRGLIPFELAEEWFDLQDSLPGLTAGQVMRFSEKLESTLSGLRSDIQYLEVEFDKIASDAKSEKNIQTEQLKSVLSKMAEKSATIATMVSLKRDFETKSGHR